MQIAAVIPCYKVKRHILPLIASIGPEVHRIYVVDDCCPQESGKFVDENCNDARVEVLYHRTNLGVGGAVCTGYLKAHADGIQIAVKLDGDGQMDPSLIHRFVSPILGGYADYTKGNRFFSADTLHGMPPLRLIGNAALSFVNKASSGYWEVMDPTNGYTALHLSILPMLQTEKLEKRYFFESDMLFRLNTIRAVVQDVPMRALYDDEESNLRISKVLMDFPRRYLSRAFKRVMYNYFLRDFNVCSLEIVAGLFLLITGASFGAYQWSTLSSAGQFASAGTVMLATLPIILGFQLLLAAITYDVNNTPSQPINPLLEAAGYQTDEVFSSNQSKAA